MFTGIVQGKAIFVARDSSRFRFSFPESFPDTKNGDSIAINGCCLTVVEFLNDGKTLGFDVSQETLTKTNLSTLKPGDKVNYELALRASDFLGGHFVSGHIDDVGVIEKISPEDQFHKLVIHIPSDLLHYVVSKGSISIDGISLTINAVDQGRVHFTIIPETWSKTNLSTRSAGDHVNLEVDMILKAVVKNLLLTSHQR